MLAQCYTGNNASASLLIRAMFRNHSFYNYSDITNGVPVVSHLDSEKIHASQWCSWLSSEKNNLSLLNIY